MMLIKKLALTVAATLLLATVAFAAAPGADTKSHAKDQSKTVVKVTADNPEFTLNFPANRTTGYRWFFRGMHSRVITPVDQSYVSPASQIAGAGGEEVWRFKVASEAFNAPSQYRFKMVYARPWEHKPGKVLIVTVYTNNSN